MGQDRMLTHNALSGVYKRLPSQYEDSDQDGVPDSRDLEPNTRPGYQVDMHGRTLDSDGDGVPNTIDDQPFTIPKYRLMVGSNGIPKVTQDDDYDGVPNQQDDCAETNVRYLVDEVGCPVCVSTREKQLFAREGVLQERRILFETGEHTFLDESMAPLDSIGMLLSDMPELRFSVDGHCDDRGTREFNQALSEARATAVVAYLVDTFPGLSQSQFDARGFGKDQPLVPSTDDDARRVNRRVEIRVLNPEHAYKYVEGTRFILRDEAIDGYQFEDMEEG